MEKQFELTIDDKEVFEFYNNSKLSFKQTNILFVSILKKLMLDLDSSINTNLAAKLLDKFNMLDYKIETIGKFQHDLTAVFNSNLNEYRKEYMNDLKLIISSNNADCIAPLIKETNNNLIDKTSLMINDLLPKNQEVLSKDINSQFQLFQSSIMAETNKLLSSSLDKNTIESFFTNINLSLVQSQNILTTLISSSESRIENRLLETERKMTEIKEISTINNSSQQCLQNNVSEILKKFENGSSKGNISEHITYNILLSLYPCAQIEHVGNEQKESGDIMIIRNNKPKILIENKDHDSKNVTKLEVEKFIRDCEIQDCCGIMFAQHKGIANKQNFELQINNGNVLLYVHEVNFDNDKIKTSIEIVEHFKLKLDELNVKDEDYTIDNDTLENINKEFIAFANQKNNMAKLLKDFGDKMIYSINELKMPNLDKYLSSRFAFSTNQNENICKYCEKHIPKSLSQHYRYCQSKKDKDKESVVSSVQLEVSPVEIEQVDIILPVIIPESIPATAAPTTTTKSSKSKKSHV